MNLMVIMVMSDDVGDEYDHIVYEDANGAEGGGCGKY